MGGGGGGNGNGSTERKHLGGTTGSAGGSSSRGSSSSLEPPSRPLPPRQFCERYSLPRVVQVSGCSNGAGGGPLGGPLLLFARYRGAKARARSLRTGAGTGGGGAVIMSPTTGNGGSAGKGLGSSRLTPVGPALAIPRGYQGWFIRLSARGRPAARRFTSLQQLVAARVPAFLSQRALPAYRLSPPPPTHPLGLLNHHHHHHHHGGAQYVRTSLRAGSVLRLLGVFEDLKAPGSPPPTTAPQRRGGGGGGGGGNGGIMALLGKKAAAADKYAQCVCPRGQVVFVPLSTAGLFYAVLLAGPGGGPPPAEGVGTVPAAQCAARVDALLSRAAPPLAVRLAAGPLPHPLPIGFSGDLLLEGFEEEEVILACALPTDWTSPRRLCLMGTAWAATGTGGGGSLGSTGSGSSADAEAPGAEAADAAGLRLLEIDADARFLVSRALSSAEAERRLFHTPLLRAALALCRERGEAWRCQVKVTHHICPRVEPLPATAAPVLQHHPLPPPLVLRASSPPPAAPDAPLPPPPPPFGRNPLQRQQQQPGSKVGARDAAARLQRSLAKLRFPTKKSSSFTYTPSERLPAPSPSPAPPPPPRNPRQEVLPPHTTRAWGGIPSLSPPQTIVTPLADELPYSHALDALPVARCASRGTDENLYAEICDAPPRPPFKGKLESFYHLKVRSVERTKEDCYYVQLDDGRYAGTLCSRASEGDYDTVC